MQKGKVTLDTIANKLGVTKVTVSKALNNQPGVSDELKKRIIQTSIEVGYTTKNAAKLAKTVSKLGILVPKRFFLDTDNFYTKIYYYMNQECAKRDISLSLYILNPEQEQNNTIPLSLVQDQAELNGIFIVGEVNETYVRSLISYRFAVIAIDFYKPELTLDCIVSDNYQSGYTVTKHLIDKGHTNIGFVGNPHYTTSIMDRYCGYIKALTAHQLVLNKDWHIVNNDENGSYLIDFSLPKQLPTAFVCHCDMAAYKLQLKLQGEGYSVPNQVSIISFDNTDLSQTVVPALTSMNISKHDFASESVNLMLWRIQHIGEQPKNIYVKSRLIERDSVSQVK
ncbi:LacI family transcriptional regulator [Paenibacillus psychroresistens]|uniref:LacI family transcriptional regulator n=1 Tax=Paenibacillus psychroresistens TaxID=1778678 RepID=A0A6B8RR59_9BACL|nr:LacI family DNA-binding transcriptional regulator [Paenibacillus psychroresistens]QGQ98192.1 LacI family transcriptional regulator [Paenibacillus psychroresistens]